MNVLAYARLCGPMNMRYRDTDQVKLIISMDTDTNVYNMIVSRLQIKKKLKKITCISVGATY